MSRPPPLPRAPLPLRPGVAPRRFPRGALFCATMLGGIALGLGAQTPQARADAPKRSMPIHAPKSQPQAPVTFSGTVSNTDPMTFQADHVSYDSRNGIATWTGNVQIWQNDQIMRADKVIYDRNTGIASARGNVAMVEPDGTVLFTDYAELSNGMRDGIMTRMYAQMYDNARLAANGVRRTGGKVSDLTRVVYTACEICARHPERAPFWQIRAYDATHDMQHKRMEFRDAFVDFFGVPIFYLPTFSMTDPSVRRQSGFLTPGFTPHNRYLGTYVTIPYYWVLDKQSDVTLEGLFSTRTGPQISANYRRYFSNARLNINAGIAYDTHHDISYTNTFGQQVESADNHGVQGYFFGSGQIALNKTWRAGANIRWASSPNYMRDYRVTGYGQDTLNSNVYLEGFGTGSYSRIDAEAYQGLNQGIIHNHDLPWVLPRYTYSYFGRPDAWGGRFSLDTTDFYVYRNNGTSDQRGQLSLNWDRPFHNKLGQIWDLTLHVESAIHRATQLNQQPNYAGTTRAQVEGQVLPTIGLKMNWPFLRSFNHNTGTQILEPIVQFLAAPNTGNSTSRNIPNEDSLTYEFTDSTLFAINRYPGTDRLDGGLRANVGLHNNWTWNGHQIDVLIGESFQEHVDHNRIPYSGLGHHLSDVVMGTHMVPNQFFDFDGKMRLDPYAGKVDFGDALGSAGFRHFRVTGGYLFEPVTPYYYYAERSYTNTPPAIYYKPVSELTVGAASNWDHWHLAAYLRRSLSRNESVSVGGDAGFQNDCFGLDVMYLKQYTTIGGQQSNSTVMFSLTFKTIGTFGMNG
ncbi:LPS-assembly protein LptD [Komagataeibacter melaceti]|uniref:LPS-assembly protein LptD n=1 Tax=Komagataeibacter melaceti TaxID=2766577 RepID=A0A371Z124_9PROT|nr:LPS assembly protein LptD [Komagataeibacter melaceti]RFD20191.1 LPS-assembly protein LptD [Komagataeibacter melaceti]